MKYSTHLPTVFPVTCHTDYVGYKSTFVAINGFNQNGALYICQAIKKGARCVVIDSTCIIDNETMQLIIKNNVELQRVENTRKSLALLSAQAADFPAQKLKIYAVTGTKGKSTTAFILRHIFNTSGYKTALLSTVKNMINQEEFKAPLTTAQPDYLHQFFSLCVKKGVTHVVMEVAAQAVTMHRVEGLVFEGIIFTNFSREHLEFYTNLEDYFCAKTLLLDQVSDAATVLINGDDEWCNTLSGNYKRFGLQNEKNDFKGTCFSKVGTITAQLSYNSHSVFINAPTLFGTYNAYNIIAAISMALISHISAQTCIDALYSFEGVPGRFESYTLANKAVCIIDCAHNPSSYTALLSTLRLLTHHLIVVFGAGGNRDSGRRPQMGNIAASIADCVIITNDNPRTENPSKIVEDIVSGIASQDRHKTIINLDRKSAIKKAYNLSEHNSIIALLGKTDADYQLIGTEKIPHSDRAIIKLLQ